MMSHRRNAIGAGLLALLAVVNAILILIEDTPAVVLTILLVLHGVTLGALGLWAAGRSRRVAMWIAAVAAGLSALMGIPPVVEPDFTGGEKVYFVAFIVLTVAAIFLVRGELGSPQGTQRSTARVA